MKIGSFRLPTLDRKALAVAGALACCANLSFAQDASVLITSFSYITPDGTTLSFFNPDQRFYSNVQNGGGVFGSQTDQYEQNDYGFLTVGVNNANGQAAISTFVPQTFWATASTSRGAYPGGTPRNQATADAFQSGDFALDDSVAGTITLVVDYTLSVTKPAGGSLTSDYSFAGLTFTTSSAGRQGTSTSDQMYSFDQLSGSATRNGEFRVNVNLLEDQVVSYTLEGIAQSYAVAAVPEPQEWALLAGGLVALSGFVRRRRTQR
jgi:hypothetical protein